MAAPFDGSVAIAQSAIAAALKEYWDPRILDAYHRLSVITRFFKPVTTPWPSGNDFVHIRVKDQMLRSTRAKGNMATANSTGFTLPNPAQTIGYTDWTIGQDDLMSYLCPVRYRFKSNVIIGASDIGPISRNLAEESMADVMERLEIALLTGQSGALAKVAKMTNNQGAYADTPTTSSTKFRIWLKDGSAALFRKGDLLEMISASGTYAEILGTTAGSTYFEVKDTGFDRGTTNVYGWLDCVPNPAGNDSTWNTTAVNVAAAKASSAYWLLLHGEYDSTVKPGAAPVDAATGTNMYGLTDWFREGSTAGVIYNHTRTTVGEGWTQPQMKNLSSAVIELSDITELLTMVSQHRLNMPELTEYVLFCGVRMAEKIVEKVGVANRFLDGAAQANTKLVNNYGFNGTMIRCPSVGTAVAVQGIKGMDETRAYLLQPGVLRMIQPGGIQWMNWNDQGAIWQNEKDTSGNRTDVYRADRQVMTNSLIELPRLNGGLYGGKPD
ncbi:MAG TPA: hypothetical protein VMY35_11995 [Phycisphaerae bacterium]|nr:hypothetical protein [Phycisphaerae bacterium]